MDGDMDYVFHLKRLFDKYTNEFVHYVLSSHNNSKNYFYSKIVKNFAYLIIIHNFDIHAATSDTKKMRKKSVAPENSFYYVIYFLTLMRYKYL